MKTINVPDEARDLPVIASVSGGKDSTALMLALREAEVPFRAVFADTGWEAPETYEHIEILRRKIGPIDVVGVEGGMVAKIRARAGFPARMSRWCTRELKISPLRAYHNDIGEDTISAVGIRRAESASRADACEFEDDDRWGGWVWRPIVSWTVEDVLAIHHRHGIVVNPLYQRGHGRVGCFPCIYSTKEEIRLIADHSPETIDKIRDLEKEVTVERARRNTEKPGRYTHPEATFFQTADRKRAGVMGIDEIVSWSRTSHGGRQLPLLAPPPTGGCFRWGMCEPPTSEEDT